MTKVYVHLNHGRDARRWSALHQAGKASDPTPYGYGAADEWFQVAFSRDRKDGRGTSLIRRSLKFVLGFDVMHVWSNRGQIIDCDVIWTHTEREHLGVSFLTRLRLVPSRPMIGQTIWLWDRWPTMTAFTKVLYRQLLDISAVHTTHSELNAEVARRVVKGPVVVIPYGISPLPRPSVEDGAMGSLRSVPAVIAVGNDPDRDWPLFARTARAFSSNSGSPGPFGVLSSRRRAARTADRSAGDLVLLKSKGSQDTSNLIHAAKVVVVPLSPNLHASGMTAVLEALWLDKRVVATREGGLDRIFAGAIRFATSGSAASHVEAINAELGAPTRAAEDEGGGSGPDFIRSRGLTADDFAKRHVILTQELLGGRRDFSRASGLTPVFVEDGVVVPE